MTAACNAPRCAHLFDVSVGGGAVLMKCLKGFVMDSGCLWHETPERIALKAARDQSLLAAAHQPLNRRPNP